jgi:peptidoglycan/LPS O-acetylase OafA/YrhL
MATTAALPLADAVGAITAFAAILLLFVIIVIPLVLLARRRRTTAAAAEEADRVDETVEPNVVALSATVGGAILGIVAVFLPALESETFSEIKQNALIQKGTGFFVVGVCLALLGTAYRVYQSRTKSWAVSWAGVILIAAAVFAGTGKRVELEGTNIIGETITEKASPGIGIYAVGVAGAIALFAGYAIATNRGTLALGDDRKTKICPDCAETVLAAARKCKHCGHEFDPVNSATT